jgi:hypothetical protein
MATRKSTQAAPAASVNDFSQVVLSSDPAIEALLAEIASTAYLTERLQSDLPLDLPFDATNHQTQIDNLRLVVARLGWMADIALQRLGSMNTMRNGDAAQWLLPAVCVDALMVTGAQS